MSPRYSTSSSSEEEGLTCLLDVVGGGVAVRDVNDEAKTREIIDDEKILQLRNLVQQIHMHEGAVDVEGRIEAEKNECKNVDVVEQVDILKREICALLVEREKLGAKLGEVKREGRAQELERELAESREMVERAKVAREQLRELYDERRKNKKKDGREASKEEFNRLREEYFKLVGRQFVFTALVLLLSGLWCRLASWMRGWQS